MSCAGDFLDFARKNRADKNARKLTALITPSIIPKASSIASDKLKHNKERGGDDELTYTTFIITTFQNISEFRNELATLTSV